MNQWYYSVGQTLAIIDPRVTGKLRLKLRYLWRAAFKRKKMEILNYHQLMLWLDEELREFSRSKDDAEIMDILGCLTHLKRMGFDLVKIADMPQVSRSIQFIALTHLSEDLIGQWQTRQAIRGRRVLTKKQLTTSYLQIRAYYQVINYTQSKTTK